MDVENISTEDLTNANKNPSGNVVIDINKIQEEEHQIQEMGILLNFIRRMQLKKTVPNIL